MAIIPTHHLRGWTQAATSTVLVLGACTQGDSESDLAPALAVEPELIYHPNQPMVVDVLVELDRTGLVELLHDTDPGVHVAELATEDDDRRHHLRVRGLAPDTEHELTLTLSDPSDPDVSRQVPLALPTNYQLPGFRPSFEVETHDPQRLDSAYRLFDYAYTPLWDPAGLFVVDTEGITRWYYGGEPPEVLGPTAIWAGVEFLDDGSLLALRDGTISVIDELGEQRQRYSSFDLGLPAFHHEVTLLANGNFLTLSNSFEEVDYSSVDPELGVMLVAADLLVEINPAGEVVWTWDALEHLDPLRIRSEPGAGLEYFDPETGEFGYDWTHGNGMIDDPERDLIVVSMRHQDWIVAIEHDSGEIRWRLGPEGDFELLEGSWFYHQHSPQWQPDGTLLLYDNGLDANIEIAELQSRAVRYALDYEAMTATQVWDSLTDEPYVSSVAGDADRMPAGNVLVLDSSLQPSLTGFDIGENYSRLTEMSYTGDPEPIWTLTTKLGSLVYRATAIDRLPGESPN